MQTDRRGFLRFIGGTGAAVTAAAAIPNVQGIDAQELPSVDTPGIVIPDELPARGSLATGPRLPDSWQRPCYDVVPWTLFDRVQPISAGTFYVFQESQSQKHSRGCPRSDTNMDQNGQLSAPQMFLTHHIYVTMDPTNRERDNVAFQQGTTWQFVIGQKIYAQGHMVEMRSRANASDIANGQSDGLVPIDSVILLEPFGLLIDQGQQFYFKIAVETGLHLDPEFNCWVFLGGLLARGNSVIKPDRRGSPEVFKFIQRNNHHVSHINRKQHHA